MARKIKLTRGKLALIDNEDFEYLNQWKWHWDGEYAARTIKFNGITHKITMHRLILNNIPKGKESDHINRDKLDNRRNNLRIVSNAENQMNKNLQKNNRSGVRGICWYGKYDKWQTRIGFGGKKMFLGYFSNIKDAIEIYNTTSKKLYGKFTYINQMKGKSNG